MKSLFQNLDLVSKRIVVASLSLSLVLLCGSLFLFSATRSFAQDKSVSAGKPMIGLGCDDSNVYYFNSNYEFKRKPKGLAKYEM